MYRAQEYRNKWPAVHQDKCLTRRLQPANMAAREQRPEQTPNGAHVDIGAPGDLSTLHWVLSAPCPHLGYLPCEVVYGAEPCGWDILEAMPFSRVMPCSMHPALGAGRGLPQVRLPPLRGRLQRGAIVRKKPLS